MRLWVAEIKYRKQVRNSNNPYEDAEVSNPEERIRDWEAAVNLSRQKVLKSSQPWEERTWIKCACDAIWTVNRLVSPRGRIVTASGKWEPLPNILVPSPSSFNSQAEIHLEIEEAFNKVVEVSETEEGKRLDRIIGKDESIRAWWRRLCSLTHADLVDQSDKISHLWKEAENQVRESHGFPRIGEGWISEVELLNLVRQVFPNEKVTHQAGPEWLGAQRIDIFMPERRVAIEYQGEQHYEPVDFFGGEEGLRRTQERDKRKARLCAQNRVQLVYFRFDEAISRDIVDARIKAVSAAK